MLESDPRFAVLQADALKVLESPDRLPIPDFRVGEVYNTWQDAEHVRGIVRRTSLSDYLTAQPHWQTVIDYDALAKKDNQKWVQKGLNCLYPDDSLCLVALSAGGEDAETLREFDLRTGKFVDGGFVLPKSKQSASWVDKDTMLVARDWGAGTMTKSGYPLRDEALEARATSRPGEGSLSWRRDRRLCRAATLHDDDGHQVTVAFRAVNFFETEISLLNADGARRIALPGKFSLDALFKNRLIVTLNEDWTPNGLTTKFVQGSVVSLDLDAVKKDPRHLKPTIVFAPTATEFAQGVNTTKNHLLLTTLENVQGRAYVYSLGAGGEWTRNKLDVPDNQTVDHRHHQQLRRPVFVSLTGFLTPRRCCLAMPRRTSLNDGKDAAGAV